MKKLFTFFVALFVLSAMGFAQKGGQIDLPKELTGKVVLAQDRSFAKDTEILLPGLWAEVTQVGLYRWTDNDDNPMGWIFGNNGYNGVGAGSKFSVSTAKEIVGAYFWFGSVGAGSADIIFGVYEFADEEVGDLIGSVTIAMDAITELSAVGASPDDYVDAFYVTFDPPIEVEGDFVVGFDASAVTWTSQGDGLGLVSSHQTGGGGAGHGYILSTDEGWEHATAWNAAVIFDLAIFPEVQDTGSGNGDDTFAVTFNVDMTDVEDFDHTTHKVWISGNFPDWIEPGQEGSIEMSLVNSSKEETIIYEEGFEPANDTGELPDGWTQKKADNAIGNNLVDLEQADRSWIRYSELYSIYTDFHPEWIRSGEAAMHINWDIESAENVYGITPVINLPAADEMTLGFWMYFASNYHSELNILLEQDGEWEVLEELNSTDHGNLYDSEVLIDLTGKTGDVRIAFVYKWTDGIQMTIDDIRVFATGVGEPEELIYTVTLDLEEGDYEYKYFSDVIGEGWDAGEWPGDPNREVSVSEDLIVNDIFGVDPFVGVEEIVVADGINVYPNPVRNILNIRSDNQIDYLRVFDLSGRMVYHAEVKNTVTTIDAGQFLDGLYILQLISNQEVSSYKIRVIR